MTTFVRGKGFSGIPPESGYPKYFGYHPKFRGIYEPITDMNELYEMAGVMIKHRV